MSKCMRCSLLLLAMLVGATVLAATVDHKLRDREQEAVKREIVHTMASPDGVCSLAQSATPTW
jgi:hypothetical protein